MAASEYSNFKKIKIIYYSCYPQFIDVENIGKVKYKKRIIFGEIFVAKYLLYDLFRKVVD